MSDKEQLIVELEARINRFEKNMKKAERTGTKSYKKLRRGSRSATRGMERDMMRSTTAINRALATTSGRMGGFGKAMTRGLAVGVVTAAMTGITGGLTGMVKGIAAIGDEAKRSGLSAQTFQEWKFVAEQNRIGIDQMVDGFKELNLRADEFAVTGKGPAAEAFERIGYTGKQLARKLKDPSKLMLEIIGRMEDLDNAAQIRVSDEIFGGAAGERFVELLGQGEDGLRKTIDRAHELGAVLDDDVIQRADELDRKFQELQTRLGTFGKKMAVGFASGVADVINQTAKLEDLFESEKQARAALGDGAYDALSGDQAAVNEAKEDIIELIGVWAEYQAMIQSASNTIGDEVPLLLEVGAEQLAIDLADVSDQFRILAQDFDDGKIGAAEFRQGMEDATSEATRLLAEAQSIDGLDLSFAIGVIDSMTGALSRAFNIARAVKAALPGATPDYVSSGRGNGAAELEYREAFGNTAPSDLAPTTSIRPNAAPPMIHENDFFTPHSTGSGGGGSRSGGRSERLSEYEREIQAIKDETIALELEAVALIAVAASDIEYANAIDFARKKAELLHAAQKSGKEITPALRAEVDALAEAYVNAGESAEEAADKMEGMDAAAQKSADAISDLFLDVLEGSKTAKEAVIELLKEILKVQIRKGFSQLADSSGGKGFFGMLGGLLGFSSGGYTGNGGVNEPAGIVHKGEYVLDAATTSRIGVGNLDAMRSGNVAASSSNTNDKSSSGGSTNMTVNVNVEGANGDQHVISLVKQGVTAGMKVLNDSLPARFNEIANDPTVRY